MANRGSGYVAAGGPIGILVQSSDDVIGNLLGSFNDSITILSRSYYDVITILLRSHNDPINILLRSYYDQASISTTIMEFRQIPNFQNCTSVDPIYVHGIK